MNIILDEVYMIFDVMSKKEAISFSENTDILPCIIISITNPGDEDICFFPNEEIKAILHIKFSDIVDDLPLAIQISQAEEIVQFVDYWKNNIQHIVVHCEEGRSRSAGVCAALMFYLNGNNAEILKNKHYFPNQRCYELLLQVINRQRS